ncbi:hypothetical protein Cgig2_006789 [Carnegiea gigantea]|uniref:Reverse transcriptase zinc-binding domain-containing protein n=1 Tax=Carnegiea gigantea TaxID=171969 RepID=A0A9Q1JMB8_9CARY|nr:hypothetical protein Cgig2_006789 [Carnegiea gigantea]
MDSSQSLKGRNLFVSNWLGYLMRASTRKFGSFGRRTRLSCLHSIPSRLGLINGIKKPLAIYSGKWDDLAEYFQPSILQRLASFELMEEGVGDNFFWVGEQEGRYSLKSAINIIQHDTEASEGSWKWVWKIKTSQRMKMLAWLVLHDKLLTNANRARRGLTSDQSCGLCGSNKETRDHVLQRCSAAQSVWRLLAQQDVQCLCPVTPLNEWIKGNVQGCHKDSNWSTKFLTTLWYIWKWRNAYCFDNLSELPEDKGQFLTTRFRDLLKALELDNNPCHQTTIISGTERFICWESPPEGWVILNTDGASKRNSRVAAGGSRKGLSWRVNSRELIAQSTWEIKVAHYDREANQVANRLANLGGGEGDEMRQHYPGYVELKRG